MDYREKTFRLKFDSAAHHLNVKPEQVVSLKFRENVGSYQEYHDLVHILVSEMGLQCSELRAAGLQGTGYLLGDDKSKIIIVQHETGLEILYIAGSIASLIALIPVVLQGWSSIRGRFCGRHALDHHPIEIRQIDAVGHLHEEHLHGSHIGSLTSINMFMPTLTMSADLIEKEIRTINHNIQLLTERIEALEKDTHTKKNNIQNPDKVTANKMRKQKAKKPKSKKAGGSGS